MTFILLGFLALPFCEGASRAGARTGEDPSRAAPLDDSTRTDGRAGLHLWLRVASQSGPNVIVMADLAHLREMDQAFDQIKAAHGSLVAARVIHETARRMRVFLGPSAGSRREDGKRFLFILQSCDKAGVREAARRIRAAVAPRVRRSPHAEPLAVTLGLGVVSGEHWVSQGPVAFEQAITGAQAQADLTGRHCLELPADGLGFGTVRAQGIESRRPTAEPGLGAAVAITGDSGGGPA
jgi:GGDEF domain-containing protein